MPWIPTRSSSWGLARPSAGALRSIGGQFEAIAAHRALEAIAQCPGNRAGRECRLQRLLLRAAQVLDENAGEHASIDLERGQLQRMEEVIGRTELVRPELGAFDAGQSRFLVGGCRRR